MVTSGHEDTARMIGIVLCFFLSFFSFFFSIQLRKCNASVRGKWHRLEHYLSNASGCSAEWTNAKRFRNRERFEWKRILSAMYGNCKRASTIILYLFVSTSSASIAEIRPVVAFSFACVAVWQYEWINHSKKLMGPRVECQWLCFRSTLTIECRIAGSTYNVRARYVPC